MKSKNLCKTLCITSVIVFVSALTLDAYARGGRGGGGMSMGGGGFSRSGPASGGSFSSRSTQARTMPSVERPQRAAPEITGAARTEGGQGQQGNRQGERTERLEDRQDFRNDARDDYYHHDHWDNWGYMAAGTVVVAGAFAIGTTVTATSYNELDCTATKVVVDGIPYMQCGDNWFEPTYSSGDVTYVVVKAPAGH